MHTLTVLGEGTETHRPISTLVKLVSVEHSTCVD